MAVEARRLPFSPPQLLPNRELINIMETNGGFCTNAQPACDVVPPFTAANTSLLQLYGSVPATVDSLNPNIVKSIDVSSFAYRDGIINPNHNDGCSNINCDFFPLPSRKRSRDSIENYSVAQNPRSCAPLSFMGHDISFEIQQQQLEINRSIALHMERVKFEIEEKRKRQVRTIMEVIEQGLMKRLREREEERDKVGKLNNALEERVKSLSIENQIWRDLAQTNEATANALRINLEQLLAQVKDLGIPGAWKDGSEDDAQSCCGSSGGAGDEEGERRTLEKEAQDNGSHSRMCRNCEEEESCVLLLPCRHLCLCGVCGSTLHTCPICKSPKNASVHVNMSS